MLPNDTLIGKTVFDGYRALNAEDYNKKVKAFVNFIKQLVPGLRPEILRDDQDIAHVSVSTEERTVVFPIYNGYIELGGVNYSFDTDGCINAINSLAYYLQKNIPDMKDKMLKIDI